MTFFYVVMTSMIIVLFVLVFKRMIHFCHLVTPLMGWLIGLSFFLILPLCILVVNGGYQMPPSYKVLGRWGNVDFSDSVYVFPFMVIWTSLMLTAITLLVSRRKKYLSYNNPNHYKISPRKLRIVILICSALILIQWITSTVMLGGIQNYFLLHWYTRFEGLIAQWGYLFILIQHVIGALQVILTAATALLLDATIKRHNRKYSVLIFAIFMVVLNMVMTGNRIYIALLMLYVGTLFIVQRRFRLILLFFLVMPFFGLFFSSWAHVRGGLGDLSTAFENYKYSREGEIAKLMNTLVDVTEASNVMLLLHIIRDFGSHYDFLYGETYTRAITFFIPRSVYPNRTQTFTVTIAELYEPEAHTSFSSTALGEMYANFGVFAVVLLPIFTLVILRISELVMVHLNRHTLLSAVLFILFAWMSRSVFAANFITILLCLIAIWGLRFEKGLCYPTNYTELSHPRTCRDGKARSLKRYLFSH